MDKKNFIIGGGITGLIWGFYHHDYTIITPDVGGQFSKKHLIWMHDTAETRKLLTDLGFQNPEKFTHDVRIGYYHDGWIGEKQTPELNLITIQKKMTEWDKVRDTSFVPKTREMSTAKLGDNYMRTLDVDLEEVLKRLEQHAHIQNGMVHKITDQTVTINLGTRSEPIYVEDPYESLISTIPAPVFWKYVWHKPETREFKSLPTTNVETTVKPEFFDDRFEMMYYDDSVKFSRVSKMGTQYIIEFTGTITEEQFKELYPNIPVVSCFTVPNGRIFQAENNVPPQENIIFSGRFAQWEYGITSEHIVKQSIDFLKNRKFKQISLI